MIVYFLKSKGVQYRKKELLIYMIDTALKRQEVKQYVEECVSKYDYSKQNKYIALRFDPTYKAKIYELIQRVDIPQYAIVDCLVSYFYNKVIQNA